LKATTIPSNNTPSSETPAIDIPELNLKKGPKRTHMWSAEEWAIRNASMARHEPWGQRTEQNNPWDYNIKIVPEKERRTFLSATVTTRSKRNTASVEASTSNQGHNTLLSPTNPMRYVPGVGFMRTQQHMTSEENNSCSQSSNTGEDGNYSCTYCHSSLPLLQGRGTLCINMRGKTQGRRRPQV